MDRYSAREIVLKSEEISVKARLLYMVLDNYQRDGSTCWPRQSTLRQILGCSERSLKYYLAELVDAGLCRRERTRPGGPNTYSLFHSNVPVLNSTVGQWLAPPEAASCTTLGQPVASHKANQVLKTNTPLPPSGGIDVLSLEGSYEGCTLCMFCHGRKVVGRSDKRLKKCHWCDGRGFMWAPPKTLKAANA